MQITGLGFLLKSLLILMASLLVASVPVGIPAIAGSWWIRLLFSVPIPIGVPALPQFLLAPLDSFLFSFCFFMLEFILDHDVKTRQT